MEIPKTLSVFVPKIIAELANRDVTFSVVMLAVPKTKRFDPEGGFERVPILTPFW